MNRIEKLFSEKNKNILNVYCTAGYPRLDSTLEVLDALQQHGADMVEVGIPYSDPLADGPVIQQSNTAALKNGMTIQKLFQQLLALKRINSPSGDGGFHLPLLLMGYLNPVRNIFKSSKKLYGQRSINRYNYMCGIVNK